jgi:carboxylesterase type B
VSVFPGSVEAAALEDSLAAHAARVLAVGKADLGKAGRRLVTAIRDQHLAHAAALRTTNPTDPNTAGQSAGTPAPSASASHPAKKPGFAKAVHQLVSAESEAAVAHRASALTTKGLASLLWGSLAVSALHLTAILKAADLAGDSPDPTVATVAAVRARAPMPLVPVVEAEQEMVRQLHAIVYGYQLALGRLTGTRRDTAAAELRRHRILRDRLTARLLNRKAEVPVADAAYVPSTNPRNATTAAKLIRQMETALVPFCGLWLAAATAPAERTEALNQVGRTLTVARQWGASLPAWPGWKPA